MDALKTSNSLVRIVYALLAKSIKESEEAVLEVTEKIQGMNVFNEEQKGLLSGALESLYSTDEADNIKKELNDGATAMLEAAQNGNFAEVEKIAAASAYQQARKATKKMHDTLQTLTTSDQAMNDYIMPVLVALQYQDRLRQDLEGIVKCLDSFFVEFQVNIGTSIPVSVEEEAFWKKAAKSFTNIDARQLVLKTALGDKSGKKEIDIRKAV